MTTGQATLLEGLQEAIPAPERVRTRSAHHCETCAEAASFGFTTRRGVSWFCLEHRADGERVLVAPDLGRHR